MSSPPDFLGMALGMMNQRRQQQSQTMDMALRAKESARDDAYRSQQMEHQREQIRQQALSQSMEALSRGATKKHAIALFETATGGDFPGSYLPLIEGEAKLRDDKKKQAEFASGASQEIPTIASQSLRGQNVSPALGRLQQGAIGAFGPEESGDAIGRLQTAFMANRAAQEEESISARQAAAASLSDFKTRTQFGAGVEIGKQRTLAADDRSNARLTVRNKETGESRTVFGVEAAKALTDGPDAKFIEINRPSSQDTGRETYGKGRSSMAKLEDTIADKNQALVRARRLRSLMEERPELFGAAGGYFASAKGLIGTAGDIGKIPIRQIKDSALARQLEGIRSTYAEDLDRMRTTVGPDGKPLIDPKSYHYFAKSFKDVNSGTIDVLAGMQVYDAAKMNDPGGRLSDADREAAAEQVGVRGFSPTLDRERARGREDEFISQIESDLDFDFKRLERMSSEKNPATIRREDVGIGGGEPGVKLTTEQQELMNSLLGGSR